MSQISLVLVQLIESAIRESIETFGSQPEKNSLSDLFLYYNPETSELLIYDDMEQLLTTLSLENILDELDESVERQMIASVKSALHTLRHEGLFQQDFIVKPFSVNLVDDSFMVLEELLFLDDDMLKLDQDLMKNLNKELNEFLKTLLNT